jgi:hypothetical protein
VSAARWHGEFGMANWRTPGSLQRHSESPGRDDDLCGELLGDGLRRPSPRPPPLIPSSLRIARQDREKSLWRSLPGRPSLPSKLGVSRIIAHPGPRDAKIHVAARHLALRDGAQIPG